jgi:hypothetical protein
MLLFVAVLGATALGLSLPAFDRVGSYMMVAAAVALAALVVVRWRTPGR